MFSSSFRKLGLTFNLEYLCQFFINFNNQCQFWNPHDEQITNLSLIFKFDEEIMGIIGNEKDETELIFEKYQLSLISNISANISLNWACRGCFGIITTSIWSRFHIEIGQKPMLQSKGDTLYYTRYLQINATLKDNCWRKRKEV